MGKKLDRKSDSDGRKKRGKKKKIFGSPIEDALACPPSTCVFYELVVGNGIGEHAVEDAAEAYRRAFESRREKALHAANAHGHECGKACRSEEHFVAGPFMSPQDWRVEDADPVRATTWCWIGYHSIHFCRKS
ncbi:MAG: hypothetical protein WDZ63_02895 [Burkholderiales bacterium]